MALCQPKGVDYSLRGNSTPMSTVTRKQVPERRLPLSKVGQTNDLGTLRTNAFAPFGSGAEEGPLVEQRRRYKFGTT